jgi:predicted nucleic acid-binding protein
VVRAVFDTNLFVSSTLVSEGLPAQAMAAWRAHRFVLIVSPPLLAEIAATLRYDRIRRNPPKIRHRRGGCGSIAGFAVN